MAKIMVPITKGKGSVEIDTDNLPTEVYIEAMLQGLKVLANRGMSKITKSNIPNETELRAEAMKVAEENVKKILEGDIKFSGSTKAKKVPGAVMVEARRLAKNIVKDALKEAGYKVSHVEAKTITLAANEYLEGEEGAAIIEQAAANLEARTKTTAKIDFSKIKVSEQKVKAAEAKKAASKKVPVGAVMAGRKGQQSHRPNAG